MVLQLELPDLQPQKWSVRRGLLCEMNVIKTRHSVGYRHRGVQSRTFFWQSYSVVYGSLVVFSTQNSCQLVPPSSLECSFRMLVRWKVRMRSSWHVVGFLPTRQRGSSLTRERLHRSFHDFAVLGYPQHISDLSLSFVIPRNPASERTSLPLSWLKWSQA